MEESEVTKLSALLHKAARTQTYYVDGAWGGRAPTGMISASLFCERWVLPSRQELRLEDSRVAETVNVGHSREIDREVQCELILTPAAAKTLGEWLLRHAEAALADADDTEASSDEG